MTREEKIRAYYEGRIADGHPNHKILDWASERSQRVRFEVLITNVDLAGASLLDVGCGLGDLWKLLKHRDIPVDYTGVDLSEKMVQAARDRHPDGRFECGDVFAADIFAPAGFDVVFCSGIFNLDLGNNTEFLPGAIARLLALVRRCVVFNLLDKRAALPFDRYFYFDHEQVPTMLSYLPCRTRIITGYLHNDFTVICEKPPE